MKFPCPHCGQRLSAEADMIGRQIACPVCTNTLIVPAAETTQIAGPAPQLATSEPPKKEGSLVTSTPTRKRRAPVLALAAVIAVLAVAAGAFVVLRGKGGGSALS